MHITQVQPTSGFGLQSRLANPVCKWISVFTCNWVSLNKHEWQWEKEYSRVLWTVKALQCPISTTLIRQLMSLVTEVNKRLGAVRTIHIHCMYMRSTTFQPFFSVPVLFVKLLCSTARAISKSQIMMIIQVLHLRILASFVQRSGCRNSHAHLIISRHGQLAAS